MESDEEPDSAIPDSKLIHALRLGYLGESLKDTQPISEVDESNGEAVGREIPDSEAVSSSSRILEQLKSTQISDTLPILNQDEDEDEEEQELTSFDRVSEFEGLIRTPIRELDANSVHEDDGSSSPRRPHVTSPLFSDSQPDRQEEDGSRLLPRPELLNGSELFEDSPPRTMVPFQLNKSPSPNVPKELSHPSMPMVSNVPVLPIISATHALDISDDEFKSGPVALSRAREHSKQALENLRQIPTVSIERPKEKNQQTFSSLADSTQISHVSDSENESPEKFPTGSGDLPTQFIDEQPRPSGDDAKSEVIDIPSSTAKHPTIRLTSQPTTRSTSLPIQFLSSSPNIPMTVPVKRFNTAQNESQLNHPDDELNIRSGLLIFSNTKRKKLRDRRQPEDMTFDFNEQSQSQSPIGAAHTPVDITLRTDTGNLMLDSERDNDQEAEDGSSLSSPMDITDPALEHDSVVEHSIAEASVPETPTKLTTTTTLSTIVAPLRALAFWKGDSKGHYPCEILDLVTPYKTNVLFDDGSEALVDIKFLKSLDLRVHDIVRSVSRPQREMYEIVDLLTKGAESNHICIRGNTHVVLRRVNSKQVSDMMEFEESISNIYIPSSKFNQYFDRRYVPSIVVQAFPEFEEFELPVPQALSTAAIATTPQSARRNQIGFEVATTITTPSPKKDTSDGLMGHRVIARLFEYFRDPANSRTAPKKRANGRKLFDKYAVCTTGFKKPRDAQIKKLIVSNGGMYLENGLEELYIVSGNGVREGHTEQEIFIIRPNKKLLETLRFICIFDETGKSRSIKALLALALGVPSLDSSFLSISISEGRLPEWLPYSEKNPTRRSEVIQGVSKWGGTMYEFIRSRHRDLDGSKVIIVLGNHNTAGYQQHANQHDEHYLVGVVHLFVFLGACSVCCVETPALALNVVNGNVPSCLFYATEDYIDGDGNGAGNDDDNATLVQSYPVPPSKFTNWSHIYVIDESDEQQTSALLEKETVTVISRPWLLKLLTKDLRRR
ncbi:uncharacterized protein V1516DRAFT_675083 [Lipomyces oligophaga]|uniref:uncharacterized protein n=1 Tax=Lipomyces oligophaga TaxID=45792 RepID=UPI0034CDECF4